MPMGGCVEVSRRLSSLSDVMRSKEGATPAMARRARSRAHPVTAPRKASSSALGASASSPPMRLSMPPASSMARSILEGSVPAVINPLSLVGSILAARA